MTDTCVCCGGYVPEGRQVCWDCEHEYNTHKSGLLEDGPDIDIDIQKRERLHNLSLYVSYSITQFPVVMRILVEVVGGQADVLSQIMADDGEDNIDGSIWLMNHLLSIVNEAAPLIFEDIMNHFSGMPGYIKEEIHED